MNIITISREFGSGGRELGKRLADELGYDYYDREIILAIAKSQNLEERYVEQAMDHSMWQGRPLTYRRSFTSSVLFQAPQTNFLLEQKRVIEGIAGLGKNCVIVGRNADVFLEGQTMFHIFVCADMEARVRRCIERAAEGEHLTRREIEQNIRRIDKNRARNREIITDNSWGKGTTYDLTVNTSNWDIKELAPAVAEFAKCWFGRTK